MTSAIERNLILPSRKAATAISLAAFNATGWAPPRRMLESIFRPGIDEPGLLERVKRPSRSSYQNLAYLRRFPPLEALKYRRMLGIHRYYGVTVCEVHNPLAACNEGFLVGEGDAVAGLQGANCGREAGEPDYSVEHDVGGRLRQALRGTGARDDFGCAAFEVAFLG